MHRKDTGYSMVTIEIRAVQRARILKLRTDEYIRTDTLCKSIQYVLGDESEGLLLSCRNHGMLSFERSIGEYGIRTGDVLLYISKTS